MAKPCILTFRLDRADDAHLEVSAEFGVRQVKKKFAAKEQLMRLSAILDEQNELVDVEVVTLKPE